MKIIRDADTVEFTDESGDKLLLLVAPKYRDILACEKLGQEEALEALADLKRQGMDTDAMMAEAQKDPEALAAAKKSAAESPDSPEVRRFKLKAVARRLTINGENIGGEAILDAYDDMTKESAAWVDEQVATRWATPDDARARDTAVGSSDDRGEEPAAAGAL